MSRSSAARPGSCAIHGLVDREVTYRFADLDRFDVVEQVTTLTCVSNPVGGELISNAVWTGYRIRDLLAEAGVQPDADMMLSMSVDGWTAGTPAEALTADDALLAIGMNGQPLPIEHGYPARLVVPGLYGYVSATKWVVDIEATRFDRAEAYWTKLGWSARGPIKTESRIDVPRSGPGRVRRTGDVRRRGLGAGPRRARGRGQDRRPGGQGDWEQATLGASYSDDTWRLWSFDWEARETGFHNITVRATDNTGYTQTPDASTRFPTAPPAGTRSPSRSGDTGCRCPLSVPRVRVITCSWSRSPVRPQMSPPRRRGWPRSPASARCSAAAGAEGDPGLAAVVVSWLSGELTQRQIGVGWAALRSLPPPAAEPGLTVRRCRRRFTEIGTTRAKARRPGEPSLLA